MFAHKKFTALVLAIVFGIANASYGGGDDAGYGGGGGYGGGYGGGEAYGPLKVDAAINSNQKVRTYSVGSSNSGGRTTIVDINGNGGGNLIMRFNGGGSNIEAVQNGIPGGPGRVQKQSLTAEPDMLIQNVQKPVIQKIRMHIQPMRQVTQEVRPVHEQIETIIAKGTDGGSGGAGGYGGSGAGGGGGAGKY